MVRSRSAVQVRETAYGSVAERSNALDCKSSALRATGVLRQRRARLWRGIPSIHLYYVYVLKSIKYLNRYVGSAEDIGR